MRAKKIISSCLLILVLFLTSCMNQPSDNNSEISVNSSTQSITSELNETSAEESIYHEKVYPEYDEIVEYNLTALNIENANLSFIKYIGNNILVLLAQEDNISYYKFVDCETGEELFRKNNFGGPYKNGFASINYGNNGLYGRVDLDIFDYEGEYKETVVPDAFWLLSFFRTNGYINLNEFPLSDRYTIRKTDWRIYLRDEKLNTAEVVFENTDIEIYNFVYPVNETQFLFWKQCKNSNDSKYGIYDVISKEIIYNESKHNMSKLTPFAVLDNKLFSYYGEQELYCTEFDGESFGNPQELFALSKDSYIYITKISPDNRTIAIISYKFGTLGNYTNIESFKIDLLDVHSLNFVFSKTIEFDKPLFISGSQINTTYLDDGTIAFTVNVRKEEDVMDTILYVLNTK
ncbi:MAG: hypothetical protein A2Y17_08035 [Clostridiales bacterium GWF2_38_85]|nr:MAG: hypothetical protein A2Y17_08035 [Clostridiales bacterium GWF2_38_85]HBL83859.1 hypothetical protein [Clostridiales bacterium]